MRRVILRKIGQCTLSGFIDALESLSDFCSEDGDIKLGFNYIAIDTDDEAWPDTPAEVERIAHKLQMEVYNSSDGAFFFEVE